MRSELTFLHDPTVKQRTWDIGPESQRPAKGKSVFRRLGRVVAWLLGRGRATRPRVVGR